ncbi:calcium proton exchanger [Apiospora kogelbergensis]|uniref:Vacuolar calcium ion transporter n=2 Tax=Apiospora kogelbergensis TaxID=1337665 RepID=A0AAW0R089_9PEZI
MPQNGYAHETTPLMGSGSVQNHHHSDTYRFFLDLWYTPGMDSDKPLVKFPARLWHIIKATLLRSKINILLFCVPIGLMAGMTGMDPVAVFTINFFAIIPLAAVLSNATEDISAKLGEQLGGLLNATFGNAVELIVSVIALKERQYAVVKSSMIGSILSNLLLVMGMCFFFGGLKNMKDDAGDGMEQEFTDITAQTTCSLLMLAAASMVVPSALSMVMQSSLNRNPDEREQTILNLSRGTAIILLIMYAFYLNFSLRTHHNLFVPKSKQQPQLSPGDEEQAEREAPAETDGDDEPLLGAWASGFILVITTVLVAICADYLVDSIDALVERANISRNFIGLILIPIVGNAAEHVTAVVVAVKNNMDLAMQVAIGSSIQIAMFVTPFLVVLGWIMGHDMTMRFETFETIAFILAVLVVIYTVQDGKSNYLEGVMLMAMYVIIAVAFFAAPSDGLSNEDAGLDAFKASLKSSIPAPA